MKELFLSWGMLVLSVVFNAYGVFVIKLRLNEQGEVAMNSFKETFVYFMTLLKSPLVVSGVILFGLAPFLFTVALSRMEIVVAYPVQVGLNFLFLFVLAIWVLGEAINPVKLSAIVLIIAGVLILSRFQ